MKGALLASAALVLLVFLLVLGSAGSELPSVEPEPVAPLVSPMLPIPAPTPRSSAPSKVAKPPTVIAKREAFLPDTAEVNEYIALANSGDWKFFRSDLEFKIGYERFLRGCLRGAEPADGSMMTYILWFYRIGSTDEFYGVYEEDASDMRGEITDEQRDRFEACSDEYLATHTWHGSGVPDSETKWGTSTLFPIGKQQVYSYLEYLGVRIDGLPAAERWTQGKVSR